MSDATDSSYFTSRAAQARAMAARAMSPAARNIHLELAADYEQRSGYAALVDVPVTLGSVALGPVTLAERA